MAEKDEDRAAEGLPALPDAARVNAAWAAEPAAGRGLPGLVRRLVSRLMAPQLDAQRAFNAEQVRLDNALLRQLDERFAATHRHYDRILGQLGARQDDIDERHRQLEQELVGHVRELAERIDLLLAETGRGRAGVEFQLAELRSRLGELEQALRRRG